MRQDTTRATNTNQKTTVATIKLEIKIIDTRMKNIEDMGIGISRKNTDAKMTMKDNIKKLTYGKLEMTLIKDNRILRRKSMPTRDGSLQQNQKKDNIRMTGSIETMANTLTIIQKNSLDSRISLDSRTNTVLGSRETIHSKKYPLKIDNLHKERSLLPRRIWRLKSIDPFGLEFLS